MLLNLLNTCSTGLCLIKPSTQHCALQWLRAAWHPPSLVRVLVLALTEIMSESWATNEPNMNDLMIVGDGLTDMSLRWTQVKMLVLSREDSYLNDSLYSIYNTKWHMFHTFHAAIWTLHSSPISILSACNILDICMYLQVRWKNSVDPGQMASLEASWFESTLFFSKVIHLDSAEQGLTVFELNARLMGLQAVCSLQERSQRLYHVEAHQNIWRIKRYLTLLLYFSYSEW